LARGLETEVPLAALPLSAEGASMTYTRYGAADLVGDKRVIPR
jgi:hypothetical protein